MKCELKLESGLEFMLNNLVRDRYKSKILHISNILDKARSIIENVNNYV